MNTKHDEGMECLLRTAEFLGTMWQVEGGENPKKGQWWQVEGVENAKKRSKLDFMTSNTYLPKPPPWPPNISTIVYEKKNQHDCKLLLG